MMFLKNIHKRMHLAFRKRAVGKSVLGDEEQKGTQGHWGHYWAWEEETDRAGAWYILMVGGPLTAIAGESHRLGPCFL